MSELIEYSYITQTIHKGHNTECINKYVIHDRPMDILTE